MEQILSTVFSEWWLTAWLLVIVLWWIWLMFYKWSRALLILLEKTLNSFLEKFWELVKSVSDLGRKESETQKIHSDEHTKILNVLKDMHEDIKSFKK